MSAERRRVAGSKRASKMGLFKLGVKATRALGPCYAPPPLLRSLHITATAAATATTALWLICTYLGIKHILVVVHEDIGMVDEMTSEKVRAPSFASSEVFEVLEVVNASRNLGVTACRLVLLEEGAEFNMPAIGVC